MHAVISRSLKGYEISTASTAARLPCVAHALLVAVSARLGIGAPPRRSKAAALRLWMSEPIPARFPCGRLGAGADELALSAVGDVERLVVLPVVVRGAVAAGRRRTTGQKDNSQYQNQCTHGDLLRRNEKRGHSG